MAVAPFDQTCATCHLDQIVGKERASGPKGIAFLSCRAGSCDLRKKNAPIGEWPEASEAELTPFMKVMIGRNEQGRALIKTVGGLNLQDLAGASDAQIKAVTDLAWEIKRLFHALIKGKASDALGDLNIVNGAKLSTSLVSISPRASARRGGQRASAVAAPSRQGDRQRSDRDQSGAG